MDYFVVFPAYHKNQIIGKREVLKCITTAPSKSNNASKKTLQFARNNWAKGL